METYSVNPDVPMDALQSDQFTYINNSQMWHINYWTLFLCFISYELECASYVSEFKF
jgi:hypothetical protein